MSLNYFLANTFAVSFFPALTDHHCKIDFAKSFNETLDEFMMILAKQNKFQKFQFPSSTTNI